MKELNLRLDGDIPDQSILDLVNIVQPNIPWDLEHLSWAHRKNSLFGSKIWGFFDNKSRLVSLCIASIKMSSWCEYVPVYMVQDVMTLPEYRGHGLFLRLLSECSSYIREYGCFGYAFPNIYSVGAFDALGYWDTQRMIPKWKIAGSKSIHFPITLMLKPSFLVKNNDYLSWRYGAGCDYRRLKLDAVTIFCKVWRENKKIVVHLLDYSGVQLTLSESTLNYIADELEVINPEFTFWGFDDFESSYKLSSAGAIRVIDGRRFCVMPGLHAADARYLVQSMSQGDSDVY